MELRLYRIAFHAGSYKETERYHAPISPKRWPSDYGRLLSSTALPLITISIILRPD